MSETKESEGIFKKLFKSRTDFYALLNRQANTTLDGMIALKDWIEAGAKDRCQTVRTLEHKADKEKLNLREKITDTLVTPLDREDIYDLSARMDDIINSTKSTVREIEALGFSPEDDTLLNMSLVLVAGTSDLVQSIKYLENDLDQATEYAQKARKKERKLEKLYRKAISELMKEDDFKHILICREIYQTMLNTAQIIESVGENILHLLIKIR